MKSRVLHIGLGFGVLLACGGDARTHLLPPAVLSAGAGGAAGPGGSSGAGGTPAASTPTPTDAGVDAAVTSDGGTGGLSGAGGLYVPDGSTDPGGPVSITIDPESIVIFDLPVNATLVAAAGFDADTGICASIIWDFSNNNQEFGRHCDDFETYPDFPYVLVKEPPESCDNLQGLWDYAPRETGSASGCIDPLARTVNVEIEVFVLPTLYRIIMNNEP